MKFSALTTIATAITAATAAPVKRVVGTVSFTDAISNMKLNLVTNDASIPVGLSNGVLTADQDPITVDFLLGDSQFMNFENTDNTKFGHIVNSGTQQALTVNSPGAAQGQNIYFSESSISDDSSQMLQYWELNADMQVRFLGAPKGAEFGQGPFTPESQNEGDGLAIALNTNTAASFVLEQQ
ncbi:hypothetical protein E3P92_00483 [Wallemia ichthyophaga]|uniref:Uncharacterized protein n=2 Tax=Wallemia ichthyophaga TaxID=245174 RepID=A0A4T0KJU6_WALIC|nr:uncharacterized protein J056_004274 [Wallemia ichthyophaga EXF-994]TIA73203.1 hypothetical protein E3P91_01580 [Wallemia ichthyophaga]EOR01488.1 hypothetical protein J056_004274 [Wallemia ichthyophaga EXF-994]TIA82155.1 hypothetical protein E3P98_01588 [Wallemia ichthyophaga]TIA94252.1 hypothetical protein E3P97_00224 [Wallemia ichthyophaga]TIA95424.1 hypothetical protein E3P96_03841 [Wallemia ichthyophaga]